MARKKVTPKKTMTKKKIPVRGAPVKQPVRDPRPHVPAAKSRPMKVDDDLEAKREAARERARKWREKKKREQDPDAFAKKEAEEKAAVEAAEQLAREIRSKLERAISDTLAGAIVGVAAVVQSIFLDPTKPDIGGQRAETLAQIWTPVIYPYVASYLETNPQLLIACGASVAVLGGWVAEYRAAPSKLEDKDDDPKSA